MNGRYNTGMSQEKQVNLDVGQSVILDSINEGVFTVDLDWQVTAFNAAAEEITGVSRSEAIGRPCCEVFRASLCESACVLRRTLDTGDPVVNATAHITTAQGDRVPIRISTALLRDQAGQVIGGVETFQDLTQIEQLQKQLTRRFTFEDIIGRSEPMQKLFELLPQVAESSSTVLVTGDSGTGKELVARALHNLSPRKDKPFVAVNCAALPDTLLESELFGHLAGAFTDARQDKPGRFERADGGTIFLDEIGDISPALQVRLLRVLQQRQVEPLGGVEPIDVDVRVIAATHHDLTELVEQGTFRQDLFYRVRVVHLQLPPLKQRMQDIPLLVEHLVAKFNRLQGKDIAGLSPDAMAALLQHDFPGNVRELENIIEQAFVLCRGPMIQVQHLPSELRGDLQAVATGPMSLAAMEKQLIADTLRRCEGNRSLAAAQLGIDPSTLYRKLKRLDLPQSDSDGRGRRSGLA